MNHEKKSKQALFNSTNINNVSNLTGGIQTTPLKSAVFNRAPVELVKLLLEKGADPKLPETGFHSLIAASIPNKTKKHIIIDPEVIRILLKYKADIILQ